MQADLEGAAQIARTAAGFDWTWTRDDVERFASELGWHVAEVRELGATLTTNLSVDRPVVNVHFGGNYFSAADEAVEDFSIYVSDVAPTGDAAPIEVLAVLSDLATRVEVELGESELDGADLDSMFRWDFDRVVVTLSATRYAVRLKLINPEYQNWLGSAADDDY
ncbi:DUF6301 family protein [Nocardia sp. CDC159]|uniref:DUF6301 family protein n=1 Tax=Nocardia pulmonis TaxID=2951408 RepID=A0A9X2EAR4_9NOCA|nr:MULTISPECIES: DUF6301 family protein [Nocardia]MCM6774658.1 DUF6301 family protein [Nocardia pulmonis]MCM6787277.1 DUF6301 family protein [Nocardia sp. CDC159]